MISSGDMSDAFGTRDAEYQYRCLRIDTYIAFRADCSSVCRQSHITHCLVEDLLSAALCTVKLTVGFLAEKVERFFN